MKVHQSECARYGPSHFQQMWISKGGLDESNPCVVHRRCATLLLFFLFFLSCCHWHSLFLILDSSCPCVQKKKHHHYSWSWWLPTSVKPLSMDWRSQMIFFTSTPNVSVGAGNVVPASGPATFLFSSIMNRIVDVRKELYANVVWSVAPPCSNETLCAWRRKRRRRLHPRWRSRRLLHKRECTLYGFLQVMWISKGGYVFSGPAYNLYGDWSLQGSQDCVMNFRTVVLSQYGLEDPYRLPSANPR